MASLIPVGDDFLLKFPRIVKPHSLWDTGKDVLNKVLHSFLILLKDLLRLQNALGFSDIIPEGWNVIIPVSDMKV